MTNLYTMQDDFHFVYARWLIEIFHSLVISGSWHQGLKFKYKRITMPQWYPYLNAAHASMLPAPQCCLPVLVRTQSSLLPNSMLPTLQCCLLVVVGTHSSLLSRSQCYHTSMLLMPQYLPMPQCCLLVVVRTHSSLLPTPYSYLFLNFTYCSFYPLLNHTYFSTLSTPQCYTMVTFLHKNGCHVSTIKYRDLWQKPNTPKFESLPEITKMRAAKKT